MTSGDWHHFSGLVSIFQDRRLPERATPAGYAALIDAYRLEAPLPRTLSAIGERHRRLEAEGWRLFTPRHAPRPTLEGHLTFALKYEGLDLAVLKRLFLSVAASDIAALVHGKPTGAYARRLWFLYEWLTGAHLDLSDCKSGRYVSALDPALQYEVDDGEPSPRHRVRNNLPGTSGFCPLVFRTKALEDYSALKLDQRARNVIAAIPKDVLTRSARFLLTKDSKSSYAIEGEDPPQERIQRWGRAIDEAGRRPLDLDELLRLQRIVIGDARFVKLGLRQAGGFVGEHDRESHLPIPDHISARPDDLTSLLEGVIAFAQRSSNRLDPVIAAAMLAFGFVYIHPFEDGNGRLHRYLIHHVLAMNGFNPAGIVFPVSAAILDRIGDYRHVLEDYSRRLLPLIEWRPDEHSNIDVLNDTGDFYRYFDATPHAEFLYGCVRKTIEADLPEEVRFLRRHDGFRQSLSALVDMPDRQSDLLFRFLSQNEGCLSKRAREREFRELTDEEVGRIEEMYQSAFAD